MGASNTSVTRNASSNGETDNKVDIKNAYNKDDFSTYNIASANGIVDVGDISDTDKKDSNNTNNIRIS